MAGRSHPESEGPRPRWRPPPLLGLSAGLHAAAVTALAVSPAAWPWTVATLVLNHLGLCAAGMAPRSRLLGPNLSRLPEPLASQGRVAVTFDDGPDPEVTPRVLDLLGESGATATFFAIGRRADAHPGLVAEIARRGHRVENHTYRHAYTFAFHGPGTQGRDLDAAQDCVERITGRRPSYVRAPAGFRNPWLDLVLVRRGLRLVSWTRRGYDTVDADPRRVAGRLVKGLAAGDVLLLHDGSAARGADGRPVVLEALPRLLDAIAERGLRPAFLPEKADFAGQIPPDPFLKGGDLKARLFAPL
jgi:peptidoglycan/xylan/chitin deacetylase (PgdA/CDA1 family)